MTLTITRSGRRPAHTTPSARWRSRKVQGWLYAAPTAVIVGVLFIALILVSLLWGRIRHIYEDQGVAG